MTRKTRAPTRNVALQTLDAEDAVTVNFIFLSVCLRCWVELAQRTSTIRPLASPTRPSQKWKRRRDDYGHNKKKFIQNWFDTRYIVHCGACGVMKIYDTAVRNELWKESAWLWLTGQTMNARIILKGDCIVDCVFPSWWGKPHDPAKHLEARLCFLSHENHLCSSQGLRIFFESHLGFSSLIWTASQLYAS